MRMRNLLQNRWIQVLLGFLVLIIWIYNSWKILAIGNSDRESPKFNQSIDSFQSEFLNSVIEQYHYSGDFRDPFRPGLKRAVSAPVIQEPIDYEEQEIFYIPELILTGIVEKRAVVMDQFQEIYFVVPGDTIHEAIVRTVTPDSVILDYKKTIFTIKLN